MKFKIISPTKALVLNASADELDELRADLTYTNTAAAHLLKRHYNNKYFRAKNYTAWNARLEELKLEVKKTLVFDDGNDIYIRPGSLAYMPSAEVENVIVYPIPKKIPWNKPLPFTLHPYQEESVEKLVKERHSNVELCTGAGKSAILLKLCRETGFKCAIIAPSKSIFNELLEKFEYHLGKAAVGTFGDGKKKIGKRITICIGDSISNIKKDTPEWEFFSKLDMIAVDESHTWGAETLEDLCHGIFSEIPYRFFLSGTQTRGDGAEKLLQSIIARTVHALTTKDAIAGDYICTHDFTIVELESSNPNFNSSDVLEMKREHFLRNKNIGAFVAKLANSYATVGKQTLILVEELSQIAMLTKLITVPYAYAHSDTNRLKLAEIGLGKADPADAVEKFNCNEVKVLIGTSCIATGTNIYPCHATVNWVGGASEIKTKQGAVGRSVRKSDQNPNASKCVPKTISHIFDFDVRSQYALAAWLEDRLGYYAESGTEIKRIRLK